MGIKTRELKLPKSEHNTPNPEYTLDTLGDTPIPELCLHLRWVLPAHFCSSLYFSRSPWRGAARESGAHAPPLPDGQTETVAGARSAKGHPRPVISHYARSGGSRPGGRPASAGSSVRLPKAHAGRGPSPVVDPGARDRRETPVRHDREPSRRAPRRTAASHSSSIRTDSRWTTSSRTGGAIPSSGP